MGVYPLRPLQREYGMDVVVLGSCSMGGGVAPCTQQKIYRQGRSSAADTSIESKDELAV